MTLPVRFRPQAATELVSAQRWYERQRPGLGGRFLATMEAVIERIAENPNAFGLLRGDVRRAVVSRFPYQIVFTASDDEVLIVAVWHSRRSPRDLMRRLSEQLDG